VGDIREIETFLTLPHRDGEVRWGLKDAGNGPAIDGRLYKAGWRKVGGKWEPLDDGILRPSKAGLWIPLEQAEQLADSLPMALIRGYEYRAMGGYAEDGGPTSEERRPGWNCPDCGTENIAEARQCGRCNAKKRTGVLA
jgi:hypothetical protein